MKKLTLLTVLLLVSTSALADGYRGGYRGGYERHEYHGGGYGWVAPLAIGGLLGYELSRQPTVIYQQPPVVYQQQPQVIQQPIPTGTPVYQWQTIYDDTCGCSKQVLVKIN